MVNYNVFYLDLGCLIVFDNGVMLYVIVWIFGCCILKWDEKLDDYVYEIILGDEFFYEEFMCMCVMGLFLKWLCKVFDMFGYFILYEVFEFLVCNMNNIFCWND